ncbi:MAG: hypothetical protein KGI71_04925 [Patescibacteria group bacterium]|nr:hypothetical protein [Patescibacteria group bacterium]
MHEPSIQTRREDMRRRSKEEAESIMRLAGFTILHVWELTNGYWPDAPEYDDVRTPWWLFLTDVGPIQIGWRKRVLHIEWSACAFRGVVTEDNVTKEDTYVHAYAVEKAVEYLREMRRQAGGGGTWGVFDTWQRRWCPRRGTEVEMGDHAVKLNGEHDPTRSEYRYQPLPLPLAHAHASDTP